MPYVGRFAPSPTGDLHLGNALAAVVAWARARRASGRCLLRMEDLDTPRIIDGAAVRIEEDLAALGLHFDDVVLVQSADLSRYHAALDALRARGLLYGCRCSRKDLQRIASAPHAGEEGPPYPGTCEDKGYPLDDPNLPVAWRLRVPDTTVRIDDVFQGSVIQHVTREVGDVVVRRKDGVIAYQLAVVVDDAWQGVTEVVRGRDLLASAPRQALLFSALGHPVPAFAHVPLWVDADGHRLSKRSGTSPTLLRTLFAQGMTGEDVLGQIGHVLGVCAQGERIGPHALADRLDDQSLARPTVGGG